MKQFINSGGGGSRLPTEDEVEVAGILLTMPKLLAKSALSKRYSFTWGGRKKRSVLVSKPESPPSVSPLSQRKVVDGVTEKVTVAADGNSPSTPLCFQPSGSGSDGVDDKPKTASSGKRRLKRKAADDLLEKYYKMQQEKETLLKEIKAKKTRHQELTCANLELKSIMQQVNFHVWNKSMKIVDKKNYHPQITIFAPPTQQQQQHCQQTVGGSQQWQTGGRFGMLNQVDPRVKMQGEAYDFMGCSQPLDQSKYLMMDNIVRLRTAAADARRRRRLRMRESKNGLLALKLSRGSR